MNLHRLMPMLFVAFSCAAQPVDEPAGNDVNGPDGSPWLRVMAPEYDAKNDEGTYKAYTHILDFEGKNPITKGAGGKFTHHRGMFIGWSDTLVGEEDYDTWHMKNCYHVVTSPITKLEGDTADSYAMTIEWTPKDAEKGQYFIGERRTITLKQGPNGERIFEHWSTLEAKGENAQLKGDLQHAGMQVRLAQEVAENEKDTRYILPEGATEGDDDEVIGAWWVCCNASIGGTPYWVMHMTPPDHLGGQPVYSIRDYARFGAFSEHTLEAGHPTDFRYRILVSEKELTREQCQKLYDEYAAERTANSPKL